MATITTRAGKGAPLTNAEVDANFTNLNSELATKTTAAQAAAAAPVQSVAGKTGVVTLEPADVGAAAVSHTHTKSQITDLSLAWDDITGKPATFAPSSHAHPISEVTGLQDALDGKAASDHDHGSIAGNAATATKLATARSISLSGDVSGSALFDGSDSISIAATVADDSHGHTIATIDGLQSALDGKADSSHAHDYIPTGGGSLGGNIIVGTDSRDCSIVGTYDSTRTQQIWSMGDSYKNSAVGTNFGNLYGLAYKHTNNTTGGTMAGGHQMVWCQNGTPNAAMGSNIWTSGNVTAYSDIRVKKNLEVIPFALDKVQSLSGYTFDRTDVVYDENGRPLTPVRQTGVVAQEVLRVLPEAVTGGPTEENPDGHYSVAYGNLVGLLIEAIKELKAEVDTLRLKVDG